MHLLAIHPSDRTALIALDRGEQSLEVLVTFGRSVTMGWREVVSVEVIEPAGFGVQLTRDEIGQAQDALDRATRDAWMEGDAA